MHHAGYVPKRAVHHLSVLIAALKGAVSKTVGFPRSGLQKARI